VDHLLRPPGPPPGIPVARLVDRMLTEQMGEWVLLNVMRFHRQDLEYRQLQAERNWLELPAPVTAERRIGILGLGELGTHAGGILRGLGFPVMGWTRRPRQVEGIETFHGAEGLHAMARQTDILVCLLPLTPETRGIVDAKLLGALPRDDPPARPERHLGLVQAEEVPALDAAFALDLEGGLQRSLDLSCGHVVGELLEHGAL
jgi:glyoxylate/hydroxypyruvate reductase A